jgi:BlaI family penicillinase repressor
MKGRHMAKRSQPRLSPGEMEILQMLWQRGPVTLSEAQAGLERQIGYTTMQTRLNRLVDKGLVTRTSDRPAQYAAAVQAQDVSAGHLDLLVERVTGGSVVPLVAHLVRDRALSPEEIAELKHLIAAAERQTRPTKNGKK